MTCSQDAPHTDHDAATPLDAAAAAPAAHEADDVLQVRPETIGEVTVLHISGEIDGDTAPVLRDYLADARRATTPAAPLVVDLSGVNYLASPGLSVLIEAHNEHRRLDTRLRVVAGSRATRVPIMTTGLHAQLEVVITLDQALPSTS